MATDDMHGVRSFYDELGWFGLGHGNREALRMRLIPGLYKNKYIGILPMSLFLVAENEVNDVSSFLRRVNQTGYVKVNHHTCFLKLWCNTYARLKTKYAKWFIVE